MTNRRRNDPRRSRGLTDGVRPLVAAVVALAWASAAARAQGTRADYDRSDRRWAETSTLVAHAGVVPHWTADGNAFWYATAEQAGGPWQFWWVDAVTGARRPAVDAGRMAHALRAADLIATDADHVDLEDIDETAAVGPGRLRVAAWGLWVTVDLATYRLTDVRPIASATPHRLAAVDADARPQFASVIQPARLFVVNRSGRAVNLDVVQNDGSRSSLWKDAAEGLPFPFPLTVWAGSVVAASDLAGHSLGYWRVDADGDGGTVVIERPGTATKTATSTTPAAARAPGESAPSADGRWTIVARDHDLVAGDARDGTEVRLTRDGVDGNGYETADVTWAADGSAMVAYRAIGSEANRWYPLVKPTPLADPRASTVDWKWSPEAGDAQPHFVPHLFRVGAKSGLWREVPIVGFTVPDATFIAGFEQGAGASRFVLECYCRGYQRAVVASVDAGTGQCRTVLDERSPTFIQGFGHLVRNDSPGHQLLWQSERDGHSHLYLYDTRTDRLVSDVTPGPYVVQAWDGKHDVVNDDWGSVYFRAAGVDPRQDPYYVHACRANADGTGFTDLTPADGTHEVRDSPDGRFYLDTYSRVDLPPVTELRQYSDGGLVCPLERADVSALYAAGWRPPERFAAKGRDGVTDIYGVIYRPSTFVPGRRYPVVEDIYAGPTHHSVPKGFTLFAYPMSIAELGFVVVQIDGMGTPGRGKAFHDVCWHDLGDCGLPDRVAWIRAAAKAHPEMDLSRGVGIEGGSFGGYAAVRALEAHPELYTVAVAQDGCYDPRLYDRGYMEQWLGWPVGPWYAAASAVGPADHVRGSLLLISDAMDHNVDPIATTRLVAALESAGTDFSLLSVPDGDHCDDRPYVDRRRKDFLVRHLMGVEPRAR